MIVSSVKGRVRFVHSGLKNKALAVTLEKALAGSPGVISAGVNRLTGSLLVHYDGAAIDAPSIYKKARAHIRASGTNRRGGLFSGKRARKYVKLGMLGALSSSLASLLMGSESRHFILGQVFLACLSLHLIQNRSRLLR